jgi:hypothetical protein
LLSKFGKNLALFVLGLALFELGRRALLPPVPWPVEERITGLLAESKTCSVLFVGPSYVENQIDPEAFDREAARIGYDARACKVGTSGLRGFELRNVLQRILSHDWPRLELVVIDVTLGDRIGFEPANWLNPRVVEWHTLDSVPWLLDYYERTRMRRGEKPPLLSHAEHVFARYAQVGRGVEALRSVHLLERFRPAVEAKRRANRARKERVRGKDYERHVERMMAVREKGGPKYGNPAWALELRSLVRSYGKEAYFLIAPVLYSPRIPRGERRGPERLRVMNFNDPRRYPELYEESVRGNTSHLRGDGNTRYSELLAVELKKLSRRRR